MLKYYDFAQFALDFLHTARCALADAAPAISKNHNWPKVKILWQKYNDNDSLFGAPLRHLYKYWFQSFVQKVIILTHMRQLCNKNAFAPITFGGKSTGKWKKTVDTARKKKVEAKAEKCQMLISCKHTSAHALIPKTLVCNHARA